MNMLSHWSAFAMAALLSAAPASAQVPPPPPPVPPPPSVDDTARLLAGLPPLSDPTLLELAAERGWQRHAELFDAAWTQLEDGRLARVRNWSRTHLPAAATAASTLFYMFSGPDYLYADAIFPGADTYILCGIEPVGPLPDLTKLRRDQLGGELQALRNSLDSVFSFSFFITKEMKQDLQNHALRGTLPVITIFLARAGMTITDVSFVGLDQQGTLAPLPDSTRQPGIAPGVKISFRGSGAAGAKTLYYFSTDISDSGLEQSGFLQFCRSFAPGNSLVKSASYLMHESYFSKIRTFLLENTTTLVQDDSGIPVAHLAADRWDLRLFGSYPGPIPLFKNRWQPQLAELYRTGTAAPLDFGIGYRHRIGESTLMVAGRRPAHAPGEPPKAVPVAIPVAEAELVPAAPAPTAQ
jgi:hypothetical protein